MRLPSYDEIHLPLLKLLHNRLISNLKEAVELLSKYFNLTENELNEKVKSGVNKFYSQVSFSLMLLIRAGLVFRGTFRTTDKARIIISQNPDKISKRILDDLACERQQRKIEKKRIKAHQEYLEIHKEYLQKLKAIDVTYFEHVSGMVLAKKYNVDFGKFVELTPLCNDGGIDGIIHLGDDSKSKVYFEAKRYGYGRNVSNKLVRDFAGALLPYGGIKGYYVTTAKFTPNAEEYTSKINNVMDITLIDGLQLVELIFKHKLDKEIILSKG